MCKNIRSGLTYQKAWKKSIVNSKENRLLIQNLLRIKTVIETLSKTQIFI